MTLKFLFFLYRSKLKGLTSFQSSFHESNVCIHSIWQSYDLLFVEHERSISWIGDELRQNNADSVEEGRASPAFQALLSGAEVNSDLTYSAERAPID